MSSGPVWDEVLEGIDNSLREGPAAATDSFEDFVRSVNPTLLDFEHVPRLVDVLQKLYDGEIRSRRLMILMPPRYFKSECVTRLFSAFWLLNNSDDHVGIASYGASLAWELSEEARNYFEAAGGELRRETSAKRRWRTAEGGELWADGVGGSLLGRGYDLGIVDDPIDPIDALSMTYQARFETWWPSKWLSRAEPGAAIVLVMQRLGVWDPVAYLWEREAEAPEGWHVVCFDEVKSIEPLGEYEGRMGIPETCTLEQDPRDEGEVLAATRFDADQVARKQTAAGSYTAQAQRQQRPQALTGRFWRRDWFEVYDVLPEDAYNGGTSWDTAYTKDEHNSASARVRGYRGPGAAHEFPIYIDDVDWNWFEFPELVGWMQSEAGPHYIEQKASGKSAAQALRERGVRAQEVPVTGGDKIARASAVQPVVSTGRVHVRRAVLNKLLEGARQGLLRVTAERLAAGGPDLDLCDAFVAEVQRHTHQDDFDAGWA